MQEREAQTERTNTDEVTLTLTSRYSSPKSKQLLGSSMRCLFQTTAPLLSRPAFVVQTASLSKRREVVMSSTVRTALDETSVTGEFKRVDAAYRNVIEKGGEFEPESLPRRLLSKTEIVLQVVAIICTYPMPVHGPVVVPPFVDSRFPTQYFERTSAMCVLRDWRITSAFR